MTSLILQHTQRGTAYFVDGDAARRSEALCRACNARIAWIVTPNGKKLPLDVDRGEQLDSGELKCVPHFATCPQADRFREKKSKPKSACPVTGCDGIVREGELLCASCWRQVPKRQRDEVWHTWKAAKGGPRADWKTYESAAKAALASANASRANRAVRQIDAFGQNQVDPG